MSFNLFDLYHPGGLTGGRVGGGSHSCPCGCDPTRQWEPFEQSAERLGIKGTPAMLAIAELEKARRAAEPKPAAKGRPWKGAKVSTGEIELPTEICREKGCKRKHVEQRVWDKRSETWSSDLHHVEIFAARVYELGNARAVVKQGAKLKL